MATSRKKQDEKNLKTLRELVSLQHNKYCFDCNQRGPTYVNVTIGSFVCTKCSGMLRGLTPPHRVKSISMATFTNEEIDLIKNRGNDYCRRVWLGLYEGTPPTDPRDEQTIRDFMIDKYERKRHYLDPSQALQNGYKPPAISHKAPVAKQLGRGNWETMLNGNDVKSRREQQSRSADFVADFSSADIFSGVNNNSTPSGFANFDNNPVFNNKSTNMYEQQSPVATHSAPPEDRYAALKDLDNALKVQPTIDWNSGSNGSLYSSSTPAGSLYSSPSPQGSIFGSPSQGQFAAAFPAQESNVSNPFSNGLWGSNGVQQVNPFRVSDAVKMGGFSYTSGANGTTWTPNPFKMSTGASGGSSNPFL